MLTMIKDVNL